MRHCGSLRRHDYAPSSLRSCAWAWSRRAASRLLQGRSHLAGARRYRYIYVLCNANTLDQRAPNTGTYKAAMTTNAQRVSETNAKAPAVPHCICTLWKNRWIESSQPFLFACWNFQFKVVLFQSKVAMNCDGFGSHPKLTRSTLYHFLYEVFFPKMMLNWIGDCYNDPYI